MQSNLSSWRPQSRSILTDYFQRWPQSADAERSPPILQVLLQCNFSILSSRGNFPPFKSGLTLWLVSANRMQQKWDRDLQTYIRRSLAASAFILLKASSHVKKFMIDYQMTRDYIRRDRSYAGEPSGYNCSQHKGTRHTTLDILDVWDPLTSAQLTGCEA